jgi:TATA-box binding protein (TBP) (component of TFIID and TFIIIB)
MAKLFDDIDVSTKTIVGKTNWKININELFNVLPVTEYKVIMKKRGRRPKDEKKQEIQVLNNGDIVTLKLGDKMRGVNLKERKKSAKGYFRNSLTIVMQTEGKFINVKVSQNGRWQLTGAKHMENAEKCIEYIRQYVADAGNNKALTISGPSKIPEVILVSVMTNINFNVGFNINRENLDEYINNNTPYYSLLETSFGYTGVNIKIQMETMDNVPVKKMMFKDDVWVKEDITYKEYISTLNEDEKEKELAKIRYCTFLAFQSGNIICSSAHKDCMKETYLEFMKIIGVCRHLIEEKIEPSTSSSSI